MRYCKLVHHLLRAIELWILRQKFVFVNNWKLGMVFYMLWKGEVLKIVHGEDMALNTMDNLWYYYIFVQIQSVFVSVASVPTYNSTTYRPYYSMPYLHHELFSAPLLSTAYRTPFQVFNYLQIRIFDAIFTILWPSKNDVPIYNISVIIN